ncbi:MAG: hypothetical protein HY392_00080 [Candidatus Diapherotrites archaeon]|nr:hypothetical protein [Candidatus Diapherotrites archaeon]
MNLPIGEVVEQGLDLYELAVRELLESFIDRGFSGYLVATIQGFSGMEEGLLLFRQGVLTGAFFEYLSNNQAVHGDYSLQQVFNALAAEKGVVDIVALSVQQVDLITAFNDKLKISTPLDKSKLSRYFVKKYSEKFAAEALANAVNPKTKGDSKNIFKKLGLDVLSE